jgi:hypothetical protein
VDINLWKPEGAKLKRAAATLRGSMKTPSSAQRHHRFETRSVPVSMVHANEPEGAIPATLAIGLKPSDFAASPKGQFDHAVLHYSPGQKASVVWGNIG